MPTESVCLSTHGSGTGHCRLRDHESLTEVRAVRQGRRVDIETVGPAPVRSMTFWPVADTAPPPDEVVANGEPFTLTTLDGGPTAVGRTA
jgi:hypothetical protein